MAKTVAISFFKNGTKSRKRKFGTKEQHSKNANKKKRALVWPRSVLRTQTLAQIAVVVASFLLQVGCNSGSSLGPVKKVKVSGARDVESSIWVKMAEMEGVSESDHEIPLHLLGDVKKQGRVEILPHAVVTPGEADGEPELEAGDPVSAREIEEGLRSKPKKETAELYARILIALNKNIKTLRDIHGKGVDFQIAQLKIVINPTLESMPKSFSAHAYYQPKLNTIILNQVTAKNFDPRILSHELFHHFVSKVRTSKLRNAVLKEGPHPTPDHTAPTSAEDAAGSDLSSPNVDLNKVLLRAQVQGENSSTVEKLFRKSVEEGCADLWSQSLHSSLPPKSSLVRTLEKPLVDFEITPQDPLGFISTLNQFLSEHRAESLAHWYGQSLVSKFAQRYSKRAQSPLGRSFIT